MGSVNMSGLSFLEKIHLFYLLNAPSVLISVNPLFF